MYKIRPTDKRESTQKPCSGAAATAIAKMHSDASSLIAAQRLKSSSEPSLSALLKDTEEKLPAAGGGGDETDIHVTKSAARLAAKHVLEDEKEYDFEEEDELDEEEATKYKVGEKVTFPEKSAALSVSVAEGIGLPSVAASGAGETIVAAESAAASGAGETRAAADTSTHPFEIDSKKASIFRYRVLSGDIHIPGVILPSHDKISESLMSLQSEITSSDSLRYAKGKFNFLGTGTVDCLDVLQSLLSLKTAVAGFTYDDSLRAISDVNFTIVTSHEFVKAFWLGMTETARKVDSALPADYFWGPIFLSRLEAEIKLHLPSELHGAEYISHLMAVEAQKSITRIILNLSGFDVKKTSLKKDDDLFSLLADFEHIDVVNIQVLSFIRKIDLVWANWFNPHFIRSYRDSLPKRLSSDIFCNVVCLGNSAEQLSNPFNFNSSPLHEKTTLNTALQEIVKSIKPNIVIHSKTVLSSGLRGLAPTEVKAVVSHGTSDLGQRERNRFLSRQVGFLLGRGVSGIPLPLFKKLIVTEDGRILLFENLAKVLAYVLGNAYKVSGQKLSIDIDNVQQEIVKQSPSIFSAVIEKLLELKATLVVEQLSNSRRFYTRAQQALTAFRVTADTSRLGLEETEIVHSGRPLLSQVGSIAKATSASAESPASFVSRVSGLKVDVSAGSADEIDTDAHRLSSLHEGEALRVAIVNRARKVREVMHLHGHTTPLNKFIFFGAAAEELVPPIRTDGDVSAPRPEEGSVTSGETEATLPGSSKFRLLDLSHT